ncbi:DNA cytosine methyltransferase [Paracoccaceae bacterium]|nr:DNA cytosine methyltransferase [Paracoccaceae bacterium]
MTDDKFSFPVVDLFAGPGGLGEGFSVLKNHNGNRIFKSVASIERDEFAHQTLHLRHFLRAFPDDTIPPEYYSYLAGDISKQGLYEKFPEQKNHADQSALKISLGDEDPALVRKIISGRLSGAKLWVLVGGPPCQAYSLVGRSRMKNNPSFSDDIRHFLYKEYLSIIADHSPPVFVMENVKGLLSSKVGSKFAIDMILEDLKSPIDALNRVDTSLEYKLYGLAGNGLPGIIEDPREFIVKAEKYGVPQARHRMFIVGVRSDLDLLPNRLEPQQSLSLQDVIGDLPCLRSGISKGPDDYVGWHEAIKELCTNDFNFETEGVDASELFKSNLAANCKRLGKRDPGRRNSKYTQRGLSNNEVFSLLHDPNLTVLTGHETRSHMVSDIQRYFFASTFAETFHRTPKLKDFPRFLLPTHKNIEQGAAGKMFSDRFRVQLADKPATTITSHISKDGHYFIHYDPVQSRSLTVREAARAQTFPDNYNFEGPRTSQYHQVGNAVPVHLAKQIAVSMSDLLIKAQNKF